MKHFKVVVLIHACLLTGCNQSPDMENEKIRAVIETEDIDFSNNEDRLAWFSYWHVTPDSRWWFTGLNYFEYWTGADFNAAIAAKNIPPADHARCTFSNFYIRSEGKIGWVTYDKKTETPE